MWVLGVADRDDAGEVAGALIDRWGWERTAPRRKVVWAECAL